MKRRYYIFTICLLASFFCYCQQNKIQIKAVLDATKETLKIQQEIIFYNTSDTVLNKIYLHNWANSYRDRKTPLSKRLIKDFKKDLYFAKEKELGSSIIISLSVNFETATFNELKEQPDIIEILLDKPLLPKKEVKIAATYIVKIPNARFTKYGKTKNGYHLRYWYLTPAIYKNGWQLMSNLNLDDLYEKNSNFKIEIDLPKEYVLESNLYQYKNHKETKKNYYLVGKNKTDIILSINKEAKLKSYKTDRINVYSDIVPNDLNKKISTSILNRELHFIEKYLGKYPHLEIYIDKVTQSKNPIYGLNQLPDFISPFSENFKWDITMFKALTKKYLENTILINKRKDYWIIDAIQNYLMIEYIETYYPEIKLLGKASKIWPLKTFNFSKLKFNDKYPFVYQFTARKFLDQALNTSADSLSNFNRKIISKYKAGLGFRFLKGYLGDSILNNTIKEFYQKNNLKITDSNQFQKLLASKTTKKLDWFFNDYIKTNKKIDHTITTVLSEKDSFAVTVKNKRNSTTPVAIYALKEDEIIQKKWVSNIDSTKVIKFKKGNYDTFVLNYENLYPELNTLNNWKKIDKKILNKPLKLSFLKDVSSPKYNQLFYQPNIDYNFYNGLILGLQIHNKPFIKRNFDFNIAPYYATKSNTVIGQFAVNYNQFFEKTKIYKTTYGLVGGTSDYAPNLSYKSLTPYVNVIFKRKSLRDATSEFLTAKLIHIDKEVAPNILKTERDNYSILSLSYNYSNPDIIKEFRYKISTEFAKNFSKAALDLRFRSLTSTDTQLDFRFFAGVFFNNNTTDDYFSFGLDRSNDYLFELNYLGRSESTGFFSQQFVITEGGFKSILPVRFANQFMASNNSSIGLWKWVEFYNDVAFLKNKNSPIYFAYENGIRFNFVHEIFEIYFPLYSNNGWEVAQERYPQKIRFSISSDVKSIYNFFRRGLF